MRQSWVLEKIRKTDESLSRKREKTRISKSEMKRDM
jgi:hypothetical protein